MSFDVPQTARQGSPTTRPSDGRPTTGSTGISVHGNPGVTVLKPGTLVDRFGFDGGEFVAPNGTAIGQRSLAPGTTYKPYSVFEVTNRLVVQRGPAKPWFGQPGMGLQYRLPASVEQEDLLLTKAGVAYAPLDADDPDPWSRYRTAGLDPDTFRAVEPG